MAQLLIQRMLRNSAMLYAKQMVSHHITHYSLHDSYATQFRYAGSLTPRHKGTVNQAAAVERAAAGLPPLPLSSQEQEVARRAKLARNAARRKELRQQAAEAPSL